MQIGWIVLAIVIIVAVISAVSQVLKGQQEAAAPPRRQRPRSSSGSVRSSSGDIDRFLQEIDRLRKRPGEAAEPPAKPKAKARATAVPIRQTVPTVEPARSRRVESQVAYRAEELPVAAVVPHPAAPKSAPQPVLITPTIVAVGKIADTTGRREAQTPLGKNLAAMLSSPQAVPMAFVLHEILGPPKCKQV